jgi:hypothetical protein
VPWRFLAARSGIRPVERCSLPKGASKKSKLPASKSFRSRWLSLRLLPHGGYLDSTRAKEGGSSPHFSLLPYLPRDKVVLSKRRANEAAQIASESMFERRQAEVGDEEGSIGCACVKG